jgi:hypothetical protein
LKERLALSINYKTYKIDIFFVDIFSIYLYGKKYNDLDKEKQIRIRQAIRGLFVECEEKLCTNIIEQEIVKYFLPGSIKKKLK